MSQCTHNMLYFQQVLNEGVYILFQGELSNLVVKENLILL
jgi:hypothetical protein